MSLQNMPPKTSLTFAERHPLLARFILNKKVLGTGLLVLLTKASTFFTFGEKFIDNLQRIQFIQDNTPKFIDFLRYLFSPRGADVLQLIALTVFVLVVAYAVNAKASDGRQPKERLIKAPHAEQPAIKEPSPDERLHELEVTSNRRIQVLETQHREQVSNFESEIASLKTQLEERQEHSLVFEVEEGFHNHVKIRGQAESWAISFDIKIRFINRDIYSDSVLDIKVLLFRDESHVGLSEIPSLTPPQLYLDQGEGTEKVKPSGLEIPSGRATEHYMLHGHLEVSRDARLGWGMFLRVTMETVRQSSNTVDLAIDYDPAIRLSGGSLALKR